MNERHFLGEWIQVEPDTGRDQMFIRFENNGRLTYTIETETTQEFHLTWRIDGDTIISNQPSAPHEDVTRFRFESPNRLVLERSDEAYVYERT